MPNAKVEIKPPATIEEFDSFFNRNPSYFGLGTGKLVRAPELDQFGLIGYKSHVIEIYLGLSSLGAIRSFSCIPKITWVVSPGCNVVGASKLDEDIFLRYHYSKKYIGDWDRIDAGISKLFADFKHK